MDPNTPHTRQLSGCPSPSLEPRCPVQASLHTCPKPLTVPTHVSMLLPQDAPPGLSIVGALAPSRRRSGCLPSEELLQPPGQCGSSASRTLTTPCVLLSWPFRHRLQSIRVVVCFLFPLDGGGLELGDRGPPSLSQEGCAVPTRGQEFNSYTLKRVK